MWYSTFNCNMLLSNRSQKEQLMTIASTTKKFSNLEEELTPTRIERMTLRKSRNWNLTLYHWATGPADAKSKREYNISLHGIYLDKWSHAPCQPTSLHASKPYNVVHCASVRADHSGWFCTGGKCPCAWSDLIEQFAIWLVTRDEGRASPARPLLRFPGEGRAPNTR